MRDEPNAVGNQKRLSGNLTETMLLQWSRSKDFLGLSIFNLNSQPPPQSSRPPQVNSIGAGGFTFPADYDNVPPFNYDKVCCVPFDDNLSRNA